SEYSRLVAALQISHAQAVPQFGPHPRCEMEQVLRAANLCSFRQYLSRTRVLQADIQPQLAALAGSDTHVRAKNQHIAIQRIPNARGGTSIESIGVFPRRRTANIRYILARDEA